MEVSTIEQYSGLDLASVKAVPLRVLVTGFGKFPGARDNPTALLVRALGGHRARLARLGIDLETDVLPVNHAEVARKLEELDETLKPDAILHFGLAARRKFFSIETRALNRLSLVHCDASGARAGRLAIIPGAAYAARSTFPYRQIEAAFRREGLRGRLSANAGDYLCNETFYLSLARLHARAGFIACAAARARQSAERGLVGPAPMSRRSDPRRAYRNPGGCSKTASRFRERSQVNVGALQFCEEARDGAGA